MKLKIKAISDRGTHNSEMVLINVTQEAELQNYIIRDSTYNTDGSISNKWTHAHKFVPQSLKAGDEVVLYTRKGTARKETISGTSFIRYIYFWNLDSSVWNNDGDVAVLYEVSDRQFFKVSGN